MRTIVWIFILSLIPLPGLQAQAGFEVPKSKVIRQIEGVDYYIHTVEKGHTVYKISKTYGITPEELIRINPEISDGLKPGMDLKIPVPATKKDQKKAAPMETKPTPPATVEKPAPAPVRKDVYDVGLMMHFFLTDIDSMNISNPPQDPALAYRPFQFIQFYEGFMMAVDSLKKEGLSIRLHVYDVSTDTAETKRFLEDPELKRMDLMIGLMYHRNFQIVADFARRNSIPIVSPVSERESQINQNPWVIKVRPSETDLVPAVAQMIIQKYADANLVIVRNPQSRYKDQADQLQKLCSAANVKAAICDPGTMTDMLEQEPVNLVTIFSENKSSILDLLTQLNGIKNQYRISVFGLPDWDRIDGLEVDYLVNLKTHIAAPYFIDYENVNVKKFVRMFQDTIRTDPDALAFIGFDVAHYFLTALMKYGKEFPDNMQKLDLDLLEAKYDLVRKEPGGYENQHWMIYYYENFRVYDAMNE
jgi:LysM repeat protein/ABC-type branched-subunit amino acid transport system substrate-binding protein